MKIMSFQNLFDTATDTEVATPLMGLANGRGDIPIPQGRNDHTHPSHPVKLVVFSLLAIVSITLMLKTSMSFRNVTLMDVSKVRKNITLPFCAPSDNRSKGCIYETHVDYYPWTQDYIHIIPDDTLVGISVNGKLLSLQDVSEAERRDWVRGLHFNLGRHLRIGRNAVSFTVADHGGLYGLRIDNSYRDRKFLVLFCVFMLSLLFFTYYSLQYIRLDRTIILLLLGGLLIRIVYMAVTPWQMRGHDVESHMEYINYIVRNWALPKYNAGYEFHQPPLYYLLSAIISRLSVVKPELRFTNIQILSLVSSFLYSVTSVVILGQLLPTRMKDGKRLSLPYVLASLLIIFWPSSIIDSVRVGNDALFNLMYALSLLFLIKWERREGGYSCYLAALFGTLALITKVTGLIVIGLVLLMFFLHRYVYKDIRLKPRQLSIIAGMITGGIILVFGSKLMDRVHGVHGNLVAWTAAAIGQEVLVEHSVQHYLFFDIGLFLNQPFTTPFEDWGGRQWFWNYLLKTTLFGEYTFPGNILAGLSIVTNYLLLFFVLTVLVGLCLLQRHEVKALFLPFASAVLLLLGLFYFHVTTPASCTNDFRYIAPALISFCTFFGYAIRKYSEKGLVALTWATGAATGVFCILIVCFFVICTCY